MEITKQQVLDALDLIEKYQIQEKNKTFINADNRNISILELKKRHTNTLNAAGIYTIGELLAVNRKKLRCYRNIGFNAINEINYKLKLLWVDTSEFLTAK